MPALLNIPKAYPLAVVAVMGLVLAGCQSGGGTSASRSSLNPVAVLTPSQQQAVRQELAKEKITPPYQIVSMGAVVSLDAVASGEAKPMLGCVLIRREAGAVKDDQIIMGVFSVRDGKDVFRVGGSSFGERRPGGTAAFCRRAGMTAEIKNSNVLGVA